MPPNSLARIIGLVMDGSINRTVARQVFRQVLDEQADPDRIINEQGLRMVGDENALGQIIRDILAAFPDSVSDYKAGKKKAIGFLIGQVMRKSEGKADPQAVGKLLRDELDREVPE
jgi:aspartyl-tRNA(Asn)/glutamyl-tRNA(Gln) amidotransferase subunit B